MKTSVSLLERLRTAPDQESWRRLDDIYRSLIRRWLLRDPSLGEEAEAIVQEVMHVLVCSSQDQGPPRGCVAFRDLKCCERPSACFAL